MADQFETWTKLLKLAQTHKTKAAMRAAIREMGIELFEGEPLPGYYRCAAVKNGPLLPVAIWRDGETLHIMRGVDPQPVALERVWPYSAWNPIPYEWYEAATERGEKWPDEAAMAVEKPAEVAKERGSIVQDIRHQNGIDGNERAVIGGNQPPEEDEVAELKRAIEAAKGVAEKTYATIDSDDEAAAAQSLRSRLNELSGTADKKREAEKRPHFDAAKAVDTKWGPIVKLGKEAADWLRAKLGDYATRKANAEAEARAKALAEEARLADERRAAANPDAGEEAVSEPQEQVPPPPAAPTSTTIKGATGRAATIRVVKVAKVVDYDKAYAHIKSFSEVKKIIDTVAQRLIAAGNEVPGVEVHERRDVA